MKFLLILKTVKSTANKNSVCIHEFAEKSIYPQNQSISRIKLIRYAKLFLTNIVWLSFIVFY